MKLPEAFLFDVGNVIIFFDFTKAAVRIAPHCEISPEEALAKVSPLTDELETGLLSADEFITEAIRRTGYSGSTEEFRVAFEDIFELNEPMAAFIEEQHRSGVTLHLLSNTNPIHVPFFEKTYPVFECFTGRIYSHEVGAMKPDQKIYEAAISQLDLNPDKTIYIDDLAANCKKGWEMGFRTFQYDRNHHEQFLERVVTLY